MNDNYVTKLCDKQCFKTSVPHAVEPITRNANNKFNVNLYDDSGHYTRLRNYGTPLVFTRAVEILNK